MAECEANEEALAHLIITLCHGLEGLLLLVDLLVLGHVGFTAEIIEVASICFRVQLGNKGRARLPEGRPVDFSKVMVVVDVLDIGEATAS